MAPGGIGNVYALDLRFEGKSLLADLDEVHPTAEAAADQDPYIRWDTGSTSASVCSLLQGVAEVELPLGYVKHPTRQGISGLAARDGYFWDHIQEKHGSAIILILPEGYTLSQDHSPPIRCDAPGVSRLSAKEFKGRIAILFTIGPYPAVRNLKTRWHVARLGGTLSAEVQRINSLASQPLPAPRKESHGMPPRKAHPGFVDTLIIIFVSVALVIFLLWAASRTAGINAFEHLPDWLQNSYRAMWTSIAAGTAGIGLAVFKVLTRKQDEPRPNYLLLIGGTTSFLIVVTLLLPRLSVGDPQVRYVERKFSPEFSSSDDRLMRSPQLPGNKCGENTLYIAGDVLELKVGEWHRVSWDASFICPKQAARAVSGQIHWGTPNHDSDSLPIWNRPDTRALMGTTEFRYLRAGHYTLGDVCNMLGSQLSAE